ncbi:MAG: hypothetical protein V4463_20925 [Pseudomonadota bacterium]
MTALTALGSRPALSNTLPAATQAEGATANARPASISGNGTAPLPAVTPVSLSEAGIKLSKSLTEHAEVVGDRTSGLAGDFVTSFAKQLFGDSAQGASISFDNISLDTSSSVEAALHGGTATLNLSDSAHFIGTGKIVTNDGQSFDFQVEVQYDAHITAASNDAAAVSSPDVLALTGRALPAISFPGGLGDLFKLLGRDLQATVPAENGNSGGNLSLRLLRLVNTAALLAPRAAASAYPQAASEATA